MKPKRTYARKGPTHPSYVMWGYRFGLVVIMAYSLLVLVLTLPSSIFTVSAKTHASTDLNVTVTAEVLGNPPYEPGDIRSIANNAEVNTQLLTISGTCAKGTIVVVYDDNFLKGSAFCALNGTFSLTISLFYDENILETHSYNLANEDGPNSKELDVYYEPYYPSSGGIFGQLPLSTTGGISPSQSSGNSSSTGKSPTNNPTTPPLYLSTTVAYQATLTGQQVSFPVQISGGSPPYNVIVYWGDGSTTKLDENQAGTFYIDHTYQKPGGYHGNYNLDIAATDSRGNSTLLQLFVLVSSANSTKNVPVSTPINPSNINHGGSGSSPIFGSNSLDNQIVILASAATFSLSAAIFVLSFKSSMIPAELVLSHHITTAAGAKRLRDHGNKSRHFHD